MRERKSWIVLLLPLLPAFFPAAVAAEPPTISIIIDDIGYRYRDDRQAIGLPGPIAYAVLPHSPHGRAMSELAVRSGKDVLLHLPMEALEADKNRFLGPGGLMLDMKREEFMRTLALGLDAVPEAVGVNNHMGSLLTRHTGRMEWLMDSLKTRGKFYVDSLTSNLSVAANVARRKQVPHLQRDVFLDNDHDAPDIRRQFDRLIEAAHRKGSALAIGHPHPATVSVLRERLARLDAYGVRLVSLGRMMAADSAPAPVRTAFPGQSRNRVSP